MLQNGTIRSPAGASATADRAARDLIVNGRGTVEVPGEAAMLGAAPITLAGAQVGIVVAAVPLTPYERTERHALVASIALAAFIVLLVALVTAWALRSALRPIDDMTRTAASWKMPTIAVPASRRWLMSSTTPLPLWASSAAVGSSSSRMG